MWPIPIYWAIWPMTHRPELQQTNGSSVQRSSQMSQRWCVIVDTCDEYLLYENIGMIPEDFETVTVGDTTRAVCRRLCSETYDLTCSGFLYNRRLQTCELSAYTGEWVTAGNLMFNSSSGLEFYRRIRCLGRWILLGHITLAIVERLLSLANSSMQ